MDSRPVPKSGSAVLRWILLYSGLAVTYALLTSVPDYVLRNRMALDFREATRGGQDRVHLLNKELGTPPSGTTALLQEMSGTARRDWTALIAFVNSPLLGTAPEMEPIVAGLEADFLPRLEQLADAATSAPLRTMDGPPHWQLQYLLTEVGCILATRQAARGQWAEAVRLLDMTARIQHGMTRLQGAEPETMELRGRILQTLAGWHLFEPNLADTRLVAKAVRQLQFTDPQTDPGMLLAQAHSYFLKSDINWHANMLPEHFLHGQLGLICTNWLRIQRNSLDWRDQFTDRIRRDYPITDEIPAVAAVEYEMGQMAYAFSTTYEGSVPCLSRLALEAEFQRQVRRAAPHHFGHVWAELPGLNSVSPAALMRQGMLPSVTSGLALIGLAKDQRRLLLASYAAREWALTPAADRPADWWSLVEAYGAADHRGPLTLAERIGDLRRFSEPMMTREAIMPRWDVAGPALLASTLLTNGLTMDAKRLLAERYEYAMQSKQAYSDSYPAALPLGVSDKYPGGLALAFQLDSRATTDALKIAVRLLRERGREVSEAKQPIQYQISHWTAPLKWSSMSGEMRAEHRTPIQPMNVEVGQAMESSDRLRAGEWWKAGRANGSVSGDSAGPIILQAHGMVAIRGPWLTPARIVMVEQPAQTTNKRILTLGIRPITYGGAGYASIVPVAIVVPGGVDVRDFRK